MHLSPSSLPVSPVSALAYVSSPPGRLPLCDATCAMPMSTSMSTSMLTSRPSSLQDPSATEPSLHFADPMLSLIVAGAKRLDMRYVSGASQSLVPGVVVRCIQSSRCSPTPPLVTRIQITHRRAFDSAAAAFAYYQQFNLQGSLFPHIHFADPAHADAYFRSINRRADADREPRRVYVFGVRVLYEDMPRIQIAAPVTSAPSSRPQSSIGTPPPPRPVPDGHTLRGDLVAAAIACAERERSPTAHTRRILLAWRRVATSDRFRRKRAARLRHGAPLAAALAATARAASRGNSSSTPGRLRRGAAPKRADRQYALLSDSAIAAATVVNTALASQAEPRGEQPAVLERIVADARRRARVRGSNVVTARDVRDAAARAVSSDALLPNSSPADTDPEHIDEVVESLTQLRHRALNLSGGRQVRVLVIGETGTDEGQPPAVATAFQRAGADVATCDLKPSSSKSIPHFQGDASLIQDLGWDLVIGHPPCTYLANSGVVWLYKDADRWDRLLENAALFRRIQAANAPFVAVENSKMHRFARALVQSEPTQYVHPWQHGHGHTKPTALHLRNLPPLKPSCVVDGRDHALAKLPPTTDRAALRSRTYPGIAAAMAVQWMPVLLDHVGDCPPDGVTASLMVSTAATPSETLVQPLFIRRTGSLIHVVAHSSDYGRPVAPTFRVPFEGEASPAVRRATAQSIFAPTSWHQSLAEATRICPDGDRTFYSHAGEIATLLKTWVIDVTGLERHQPFLQEDNASLCFGPLEWTPLADLSPPRSAGPVDARRYTALCGSAARSPVQPLTPPPSMAAAAESLPPGSPAYRPWLVDLEDLPLPPPTQRNIRRIRGRWHVWSAQSPGDNSRSGYQWCPLPATLQQQLDCYATVPPTALPPLPESKGNPDQQQLLSNAIVESTTAAVVHSSIRQRVTSAFDFAALWDARPRNPPRIGLAAAGDPPVRTFSSVTAQLKSQGLRLSCNDLADKFRTEYARLVRGATQQAGSPCPAISKQDASWVAAAVADRARLQAPQAPFDPNRIVTFDDQQRLSEMLQSSEARRLSGMLHRGAPEDAPPIEPLQLPPHDVSPAGTPLADPLPRSEVSKCYAAWVAAANTDRVRLQTPQAPVDSSRTVTFDTKRPKEAPCPTDEESRSARRMDPTESAAAPTAFRTPPSAHRRHLRQERYRSHHGISAAVIPDAPASADIDDEVAMSTPIMEDFVPQSMFVRHFAVTRYNRRSRNAPSTVYQIAVSRAMADPGASTSLVTTGMLAKLPADCCLSRDPSAEVVPLNGANGRPLVTNGTVKMQFTLDDQQCQHTFTVVEGTPLLLLGNDFLTPRKARINMNEDGKGNGTVHLLSQRGRYTIEHSFAVSSNAQQLQVDCIAAVTPEPAVSDSGKARPPEAEQPDNPDVQPLPAPLLPGDVAAEALKEWHLTHTEHLLYTERPIRLPPRSIVTAHLRAPKDLVDSAVTPSCTVDRIPQRPGLENPPDVRPGLTSIVDGFVQVTIVNLSRKAHTLASHSPVALLDSEYYVRGSLNPDAVNAADGDYLSKLTPEQLELVKSVKIDPDNRLSDEQRQRVLQLVAQHVDAFATDPKNPTKTHLLEVELPLKADAVPHRHAASRVGEAGREIIEKHIQEMESRGIIRKSNSAWGSRVVLVSKKDGTIRFCVDYRDLNSKLKVQDSPLPLTVEALDRLGSGKGNPDSLFLSTLDLAAGFWTVPIKEEDKHLTAFVTHRSKYEFNYLPFGINCGPSYMCRLMDAALQGLAWETCMPYLDDVGVWSTGVGETLAERETDSFEKMMANLHAVFERLKWAGLSMKASKCELFATSAEYLGHVMSRDGLKMDPKKIAAVKAIDPTTINTIEKVRSFLGLCSYYRRFVSGFSKISAPISDLTRDGVDVEVASQTDLVQTAVRQLIDSITSEPVLAPPRADKPFIVKTDAANTEGLGGVLSQLDDDGQERVVAYYGRRLNKHERRYTVTEIELLAAIESIKNWRPYLWGHPFKLVIDHSALRWLHTMRDTMDGGPASRLMRWILKLSEYNFEVEHKPGLLHKDADGVSRLVAATTTARSLQADERSAMNKHDVITGYLDTGAPTLQALKDAQKEDKECQLICQYLEGNLSEVTSPSDLRRLSRLANLSTGASPRHADGGKPTYHRRLLVEDGVIYRLMGSPKHAQSKLPWVPDSLRIPVIAAFHDHMGHLSRDRTIAAIAQRYYWPRLRDDVALYVEECHECTLSKPPRSTSHRPVGPTIGRYPFDLLYADILDMSNTSDYDAKTGKGARKLIVFADSLSRWVEAVPLHKDPTSEQILDIFMEHIVSRYGVPRRVVTDRGSNLASRLCDAVLTATGVSLRPTAAEHHQAAGIVERFHRTLINMTRASDEGGLQWHHHLPFILFAYRATPHRITKFTPAMLLYGRELRAPAQIGVDTSPAGADLQEANDSEQDYASRLHHRLVYAWQAAHDASKSQQSSSASDTVSSSPGSVTRYQVGDRVARKLYGAANKLEYLYAGPYRVTEVLDNGRYRLQDLENKHIFDEFDVSNLRPYRTPTEKGELTADEYIVDKLLDRRRRQRVTEYLIKWRGYPKSQATWEPREELERRCEDLLAAYDSAHPPTAKAKPKVVSPSPPAAAPTAAPRTHSTTQPLTDTPSLEGDSAEPPSVTAWPSQNSAGDRQDRPLADESDEQRRKTDSTPSLGVSPPLSAADPSASVPADSHLPYIAKFEKGRWYYGRRVDSPKGPKTRFLPAANFTPGELESDHFEALRSTATADIHADPTACAVFHATTLLCQRASKVWFYCGTDLWCHHRTDSAPNRRQYDTFGGVMDPSDNGSYAFCARRELAEEATLHSSWKEAAYAAFEDRPMGDVLLELAHPSRGVIHSGRFLRNCSELAGMETRFHRRRQPAAVRLRRARCARYTSEVRAYDRLRPLGLTTPTPE